MNLCYGKIGETWQNKTKMKKKRESERGQRRGERKSERWGDIMKELDGELSIIRGQNEAANRKWFVPQ